MRLVQFEKGSGEISIGVQQSSPDGDIVDLRAGDPSLPSRTVDLLRAGPSALQAVNRVIESGKYRIARSQVRLLAPLTQPDKILCAGHNYLDHCRELDLPPPKIPYFFNKFPSTIIGPFDDLVHPSVVQKLDWEVEMAIVIGKETKNVEPDDVMDHVFGFTVALDLSARDLLTKDINGGQWMLGKSMDNFCPLGPAIVTADEIDNGNLEISCSVNGVIKQKSNTNQMIHKTEQLVSYLSRYFSLYPGDVILTGTPPGVGWASTPPQFLKVGDTIECEIEGIGKLINKVV